jgi:RNA polymerase sigma-70 factor (ECF subfamily)
LIRSTGDWDVAEEAVQDAFTTALERWPRDGVPRDPLAWNPHRSTPRRP